MAFTKVTNAGIGSTNTVLLHNLNVVGTVTATDGIFSGIGSFGGNVSIGGVLTYEDVTNVDSVGLITARNGITVLGAGVTIAAGGLNVNAGVSTFGGNVKVGSGITLSPDGNLYSVGVSTFKDIVYVADKILHDGDGDTTIRFPSADTINLETGGTARIQVDSSGYVQLTGTRAGALQSSDADTLQLFTASSDNSINRGSGITFYNHDGSGNEMGGTIQVAKENGTADNVASYMRLSTRPAGGSTTERLRIDSTGRLLVGTTAGWGSDVKLHLGSSANTYAVITSGTSNNGVLAFSDDGSERGAIDYDHNGDHMLFKTAAAERLRIDSSGDVLIGGTSSTTVTGAATPFQVHGSDGYTGMSIIRSASAGAQFQFAAGSSGDNVSDNDTLGHFKFFGYHTNGYDEYARITAEVDGTNGDGDAPGALTFSTTADGASSPTERMRIDQAGNIGINNTGPAGYGKFVVTGTGNIVSLNASSGKATLSFFENGTGRFYLKTLDGGDGLSFVDADNSTSRMSIDANGILNIPASTNSSSLTMNPGSNAGSLVFDRNGWIASMIRASDGGSNVGGASGGGSKMQLNKEYIQFFTFPYTTNVGDAPTWSTRFQVDTQGVSNYGSGNGNGRYHFSNSTANTNRHAELSFARTGGSNRGTTACIYVGENSNAQGEVMVTTSASNGALSSGVIINNNATSWSSNSDTRLKNKISDITNALTGINQIDTWKFSWKSDSSNTPKLGVTAQSVQTVYPETVSQRTNKHDESDTTEYLNVAYTELVPVCIAAIKELKAKVETLETEVAALKSS